MHAVKTCVKFFKSNLIYFPIKTKVSNFTGLVISIVLHREVFTTLLV